MFNIFFRIRTVFSELFKSGFSFLCVSFFLFFSVSRLLASVGNIHQKLRKASEKSENIFIESRTSSQKSRDAFTKFWNVFEKSRTTVDYASIEQPDTKWSGKIKLGFNLESGDIEKEVYNVAASLKRILCENPKKELSINLEQNYERENHKTKRDELDALISYKVPLKTHERISFVREMLWRRNHFKHVNARIITGIGLCWRVYEKEITYSTEKKDVDCTEKKDIDYCDISFVVGWEWVDLPQKYEFRNTVVGLSHIEWKKGITPYLNLFTNINMFVEKHNDFRLESRFTIQIPLSAIVSLETKIENRYYSSPEKVIDKDVGAGHLKTETGLVFQF